MHNFEFGDIIENGWASDDNPTKRGVFIRYIRRTGKLNPGKHAVVRFDGGGLGEFRVDMEAKLQKVGSIFDDRDEARQIVRDIHWMARRYADGRNTYAPSMFNQAIKKAVEGGWLQGTDDEPLYARDGSQ